MLKIENLSTNIITIFKNETNIKITQKNVKTIGNFNSKLKDSTSDLKKSNVVYKIKCNNCDLNYIGTSSRNLTNRITSHKSDIKLNKKSCALTQYFIEIGHKMLFEETKVLYTEQNIFLKW